MKWIVEQEKELKYYDVKDGNEVIEGLAERLVGRYAPETILHPETGEVLIEAGKMIKDKLLKRL